MTACTQPGCTGMIVDGYCEVCGSPAGAVPFVPDYRTRVEDAQLPDDVREAALCEVGKLERTSDQSPESGDIRTRLDAILDLPWSTKTADWIDIQGSREVEATLRRLIEPAAADVEEGATAEVEPAAADVEEGATAEVEPVAADVEEGATAEVEPAAADVEGGATAEVEPAAADVEEGATAEVELVLADVEEALPRSVSRRLPILRGPTQRLVAQSMTTR